MSAVWGRKGSRKRGARTWLFSGSSLPVYTSVTTLVQTTITSCGSATAPLLASSPPPLPPFHCNESPVDRASQMRPLLGPSLFQTHALEDEPCTQPRRPRRAEQCFLPHQVLLYAADLVTFILLLHMCPKSTSPLLSLWSPFHDPFSMSHRSPLQESLSLDISLGSGGTYVVLGSVFLKGALRMMRHKPESKQKGKTQTKSQKSFRF